MRIVYTVVFAISALLIVLLIANYKNKISITYIILYASLAISNFGSMQMASANNVETAVFANQTNYLGACFSPFLLVMCIADLCKFKIGKVYQAVFAIYATILFTFVSTVGVWPLYYKSVSLEKAYGISILVKEYGPFHLMYPIYLVIMCAGAIDIIVLSIKKSKDVSYNTCFLLLACMLLVIGIYVVEKAFRIKLDLLPFAYIFAQIICMYLLKRVSSYELSAISYSAMMGSHRQGFILYNNKGKYLGSDEIAKKWFPELIELRVDSDIKKEGTPLFNQIGKWMQEESNNEVAYIEKDIRKRKQIKLNAECFF